LRGLLSLGDTTLKQKIEEITPDQRAFLFLVETTGTIISREDLALAYYKCA
jgi:hypothetical protein